jgi:hypothetical protein
MRISGEADGKMLATAMVEACSGEAGTMGSKAPETTISRPLRHALKIIPVEAGGTVVATVMVEACREEEGLRVSNASETARSRSFGPALEIILG